MRSSFSRAAALALAALAALVMSATVFAQGTEPGGPPAPSATTAPQSPHGQPDEEEPQENPHQQKQAPQDGSAKEQNLPVGTLAVVLRDAFEAPMQNQEFELLSVRSTVAEGDSKSTQAGETDQDGTAVFSDLKYGSAYTYKIVVKYRGAMFSVGNVRLDDRSGTVALLHVYEPKARVEEAGAYGSAVISIGMKEDVLEVTYQIIYINPGPYALILNQQIKLPAGHKALTVPNDQYPTVTENEPGVVVQGTLPPGKHVIPFNFHVPLESDGQQTLSLDTFPRIARAMVRITASKKMQLEVAGFQNAQRHYDGEAQWLETMKEMRSLNDPFIENLNIKISGLPTRPWGGFLAGGLAFVAFAAGGAYALSRRSKTAVVQESYEDLVEAKRALLNEFLALERAHKKGEIGPKSYAKIRKAMLDALARIMENLEKARLEKFGTSGTG